MEINKQYEVPYPPAVVYRAWISSDTVIEPATSMDIKPEVGGHYRLIMEMPEFTMRNEGTFSIVEPNEHLKYSWEWNNDGEVSEIDVRFNATANGTRITIFHTGFQKDESVASHDTGWDSYIRGLEELLAGV